MFNQNDPVNTPLGPGFYERTAEPLSGFSHVVRVTDPTFGDGYDIRAFYDHEVTAISYESSSLGHEIRVGSASDNDCFPGNDLSSLSEHFRRPE